MQKTVEISAFEPVSVTSQPRGWRLHAVSARQFEGVTHARQYYNVREAAQVKHQRSRVRQ